ncbi:MAG: dipeptidase [Balneolaceae bacterium]
MKRRDVIKSLALLPFAGSVLPIESLVATPAKKERIPSLTQRQESPLHREAFVMDGHVHVMSRQLLQGLDIGDRYSDGTVDLPRAIEGGLDAMFFSVYTEEDYYPGRHEVKNTFRVVELALEQIEKNNDVIELALTASDIERINRRDKMAAFLDLEGAFDLEGDLHLLRALYRLGLRSAQLTAHNVTNAFIDATAAKRRWGGINDLGRTIIAEMNRLGMVINVAHASDEGIYQAVEASDYPVAYTHGGFRGIVDHPRCITDENAVALAAKGGVIGIQFGNVFNNPKFSKWTSTSPLPPTPGAPNMETDPSLTIAEVDSQVAAGLPFTFRSHIPDEYRMSVDQLARVIDYGVQLVGEDHIALGADFDGGPKLPHEIETISDYPQITLAMQRLGYSEERIKKILGLNWLRLIRQVTEGNEE